ncbi:hypothetical protein UABAM_01615 [Candidatus Uabimicrobium amorphum]|uniref:Uncharacterized protein n=1 Tax=Uabimicrobium amorphum TaxID=2596890 RepID=A0A5S9IK96_UABAM|nr:hypothetical protein UABAM_01615 [Candidatus Uabimicrobium amorphum]
MLLFCKKQNSFELRDKSSDVIHSLIDVVPVIALKKMNGNKFRRVTPLPWERHEN